MKRQIVKPLSQHAGATRCAPADPAIFPVYSTIVFAYADRPDPARLRDALARVLDDYTSVGSRLVRKPAGWHFQHGSGALLEFAESTDSCRALGNAVRTRHSKLLCPKLPAIAAIRGKAPLFGARLTRTPDGCMLGVSWNHALGDHHSKMLLLRAWAHAYRGQPYTEPFEPDDRSAYFEKNVPEQQPQNMPWRLLSWREYLRLLRRHRFVERGTQRVAFEFSWDQIDAIHTATGSERAVSPADALCAYILATLHEHCGEIAPKFVQAFNYRKKLGLPANLMGNWSDLVSTIVQPGDSQGTIASALRSSIEAFGPADLTMRHVRTMTKAHPGLLNLVRLTPFAIDRIQLLTTNLSRMGHHQVAFESRPKFVHARGTDFRLVGLGTLFASSETAGLTLDIVLPKKLIKQLQECAGWTLQAADTARIHAAPPIQCASHEHTNRGNETLTRNLETSIVDTQRDEA